MSGLDAAAGVAGLVALGIQCCSGIINFYGTYRDFDAKMKALLDTTTNCKSMLETIQTIPVNQYSLAQNALPDMENCIVSCKTSLAVVETRLKGLNPSDKGLWKHGKSIYVKSKYSFMEKTIASILLDMESVKEDLTRSMVLLGM